MFFSRLPPPTEKTKSMSFAWMRLVRSHSTREDRWEDRPPGACGAAAGGVAPRGAVLAHPRGRHFHYRQGLKARWEKVFAACADSGVAVEINGFPRRQDLDPDLARLAVSAGCEVILASDAHAVPHLEYDAYAAAIAIRAEVHRERILNVLHADEFETWMGERSYA